MKMHCLVVLPRGEVHLVADKDGILCRHRYRHRGRVGDRRWSIAIAIGNNSQRLKGLDMRGRLIAEGALISGRSNQLWLKLLRRLRSLTRVGEITESLDTTLT